MKLSIIIPCFNAENTIATQLEALANQQWNEPWEVIIADNGSTDSTQVIAEQYRQRIPHLRIIDASGKRGAAYARNVGAAVAKGEALAFCDDDDEVAPGWVAAMGEALSVHDFVACRMDYEKLNEPWTLKHHSCPQAEGLIPYRYPPYLPHAAGTSLGVKRSVHEAVGGFDESMLRLHDTDYCWRIQLAGIKLHFVPEAVIYYRFRHTLGALYHQSRVWGEHNVLLYKKYRSHGMPKLSLLVGLKGWVKILLNVPECFLGKARRAGWLQGLGWRIGRLQGSIKYKVLAL